MITDLNVTARAGRLLLDVPAPLAPTLRERLDGLIFTEDAQVADQSAALEVWTAIPPGDPSGGVLQDVIVGAGEPHGFAYPEIGLDTFEVVRIERGIPRFLVDMDTDTIPLEAGIEDRAISFTKGCYVGQEVIVRVTHRGGGRVAKKLVRWKAVDHPTGRHHPSGLSVTGARIFSAERDIGRVTSAVFSPAQDAVVGLGYVHRDFVAPGTEVTVVWNDARSKAVIE
jgi:folate-binding protein YgfZ